MGQVCREVHLSREVVVQEKGAGQPSVAAGRLLFVDTATPVHQMVGRWICVCVSVCVRALLINACARSLSHSLTLSLCMHRRGH